MSVREADEALIEEVCSRVRELTEDGSADAEAFVRQFYRWISPEDIAERDPLDLYGLAVGLLGFARQRAPGETKLRVYTPQFETHGWQSTHTAVEVVTDDKPFLIDSITMELNRRGYGVHLIIHPVLDVRRDEEGELEELLAPPTADSPDADRAIAESVIHVEVNRQTDPDRLEELHAHVLRVIGEVGAAVDDWAAMRERAHELAVELRDSPPPGLDEEEVAESRAFLEWLEDHNFTFLGYRDYELIEDDEELSLQAIAGSGLGILRQAGSEPRSRSFDKLPPEVRALALEPHLLNLTKANSRATVHRPSYLDYVGVKRFDAEGNVVGERRFLGLYTHTAYESRLAEIPILRRKSAAVLRRAAFPHGSHNEKALIEVLEAHPRDELFQVSPEELFETAIGILHLGERQRLRLFVRRDRFGRFFSCLVFVPRDRFNTENRRRIEAILRDVTDAKAIDYTTRVSESVLVRLHYMAYIEPGRQPEVDTRQVELLLVAATRSWGDDFEQALLEDQGEERGTRLFRRYGEAFPTAYRADWVARSALADLRHLETLPDGAGLEISLYRPLEAAPGVLRAKLYRGGRPLALSDVLPLFENMGVQVADERPYAIKPRDGEAAWIYDFGLVHRGHGDPDAAAVREAFQEAFARTWRGEVENDGYNRLVLAAGLTWRDVTVLRAVARYLRQTGSTYSDRYVEDVLTSHPDVAALLLELFRTRFDPARADPQGATELERRIEKTIDAVESLDRDLILRRFLSVVRATLRTNFFRTDADGKHRPYLSFKLDPTALSWLPEPRPAFEIFVYSPRTEGVHLRGGRVARGGLRWSDRREDFRTEVLGLMKAQMVKNAVIVPVGAKGGFVVKRPPEGGDREELLAEVEACYRTFIRGLLDVTDNIVSDEIEPPPGVVRYDGDDPYLVVAADKGTATFSDMANSVAAEYDYWLGDAFASGGSSGYDHKRMGITAAGAWESVKRHFRELGHNVSSQPFSVVGVGDMSGDVFGNGMLLSKRIRLVAAFNHREIFIDPDPDPGASWEERKRLFGLQRSSWSDYDRELISRGGGVWPRTAKSVELSEEAQELLGLESSRLTPNELIRGLLRAQVDLLWNGGIGTYVKASAETHSDAGDKSNDGVRVNGDELRCRVVGEGGNLGFTQPGRVEYALGGGRINTDAIDNSAGVDCSDREVNIKILLDAVVRAGDMTVKQRDVLMARMTDAVADLVLKDNYEQAETLSLAEEQAPSMLEVHQRFIRALESAARLDRELEALPDEEELADRARAHRGLTRPELAVLLAFSKVFLYTALLDSDVPEDPYLSAELPRYFPPQLPEEFREVMGAHRLGREIVATQVVNNMLHGGGMTFAFRLHEETGAPGSEIARAYAVAREVFEMRPQWNDIEALDNEVDPDVQLGMLLEGRRLIERGSRWLLRNRRAPMDITSTVEHFSPGAQVLYGSVAKLLDPADVEPMAQRVDELRTAGVPDELATRVASLPTMYATFDVVEVGEESGLHVEAVAAVHFRLGRRLHIHWLRDRIVALGREDRWKAMARAALRDDLYSIHRGLTAQVLQDGPRLESPGERVDGWIDSHPGAERCLQTLADIRSGRTFDLTTLSVGVRAVRNLMGAPQA